MRKFGKMKAVSSVLAAVLTAAFMFGSTTAAFASTSRAAELQNKVDQMAGEEINLPYDEAVVAEDGMIEYHVKVKDLNHDGLQEVVSPDDGIMAQEAGVIYRIDWTVNPDTRHISAQHSLTKGQTMSASVIVTPTNKDYWLGIMTNDGEAWYVRGRGGAAHKFSITRNSKYRVFIQNNYTDSTVLNALGSYTYE